MKGDPSTAIFGRRAWIRASAAGLPVFLAKPLLPAQDARVGDVLQSKSSLTGGQFDDRWVEPTATLVSAILEDSK